MSDLSWRDEVLFEIHAHVDKAGFAIQYVMGEGFDPPWGYTIGFLAHGHPEVIVFGLDPECTAGGLHRLFDEIAEGVFRPVGLEHRQAMGDPELPLRLLPVPDEHWDCSENRLCVAVEYYQAVGWARDQLHAVQLVWATPSGHFPWQAGCSARFRRLQPILDPEARAHSERRALP